MTENKPAPNPDAVGPKLDYELRIFYPSSAGGDVVESGRVTGRQLAARLRDHADGAALWGLMSRVADERAGGVA